MLDQGPRAGSMLRGALYAAAFAAVGAGLWLAIAWYTGLELALIAWAVGCASGLGMLLGRHRRGSVAGFISALLAAAGVVAGKVLVFYFVMAPLLVVLALLTQEKLEHDGIESSQATAQQTQAAREKARAEIRALDTSARRTLIRGVIAAHGPGGGVLVGLSPTQRAQLFFRTMFARLDALALVLAIGSAFKLATLGGAGGA
jgi:hypothetical protein